MMMKKIICTALILIMTMAMSIVTFATEPDNTNDVIIQTSISPTYTVTIPANTTITFNETSTEFGSIELTQAQINPGYVVKVTADAGELQNTADSSKTIPYILYDDSEEFTSAQYDTAGDKTDLSIGILQEDWNSAFAGSYEGIITFTIEYVEAISERN